MTALGTKREIGRRYKYDLAVVAKNTMRKHSPIGTREIPGIGGMATPSHAPSAMNVCAIVVAYFPDEGFEARLQSILPQVARLVVVDNTPEAASLSPAITVTWEEQLHRIANHANRGVAEALNQGLEYASQQGYPWALTLDQDTQCYPDMVAILGNVYEGCSPKPAVIGGNYFDPRNHKFKVHIQGGECLEQKTVITSGSLIDTRLARAVGGFREDFFIDQVDHEFCLRMRSRGYRVVISRKPVMAHSVGTPGGVWFPFLGTLPGQPPLRKYFVARNSVVTVCEYWRREPEWCLRRSVRLALGLLLMATLEKQRLAKIRAFVVGFMDGVRRRMGPCRRKWLF